MNEISITDSAGVDSYDNLRKMVYFSSDIFLICFAISCQESLANVEHKVKLIN